MKLQRKETKTNIALIIADAMVKSFLFIEEEEARRRLDGSLRVVVGYMGIGV
jgi:hypothetical protein